MDDPRTVTRGTDDVRRADFLRLTGVAAAGVATPGVFAADAVRVIDERACAEWLAWELWQRDSSAVHISDLPLSVAWYLGAFDREGRVRIGRPTTSPDGFIVGDENGYFSFTLRAMVDFFVGRRIFGSMLEGRSELLASAQTSHATDLVIRTLVQRHDASVGLLASWMRRADSPVLRVNSAGVLAKLGKTAVTDAVVEVLKDHRDTRQLYLTAVASRVLAIPWQQAGEVAAMVQSNTDAPNLTVEQITHLAAEVNSPRDGAARWCSAVLLHKVRDGSPDLVRASLLRAMRHEPCRENLRTFANVLAGNDVIV